MENSIQPFLRYTKTVEKLYTFFSEEREEFTFKEFTNFYRSASAYKVIKVLLKEKVLKREGDKFKRGENYEKFLDILTRRYYKIKSFNDSSLNSLLKIKDPKILKN